MWVPLSLSSNENLLSFLNVYINISFNQTWAIFSHYFFKYSLCPFSCLLLFGESHNVHMLDGVSHVSESLPCFPNQIFLINPSSALVILSSGFTVLRLNALSEIFISLLHFFILELLLFFFIISNSLLIFCIC